MNRISFVRSLACSYRTLSMTPLTRIRSFATGMILLEWTYFVEAENVDERITMTPDCAKVRIGYYFDM